MGGFNMGISFDRFEENVKKFMELPIKYLDSAHDKAVEFMEDVHAILYPPFTDDGVPDKEDESSHHVITESSPTSVGTEQVEPDAEASTPPTSLIAVDGCVVTDAHQTESFSTKSTELAIIPQDDHAPHALETDKVTEQVGLHCSGHSDSSVYSGVISPGNSSANYEEKMILHSANYPVGVTVKDSTAISQDENVPQALHLEQVTEQAGLDCSGYSETVVGSADFVDSLLLEDSSANYEEQMVSYSANVPVEATKHGTCISHNSGTDESSCFEDPSMLTDDPVKFVDIDLMDGKIEVSSVPEQRNTSFKKMFMTSLSRKLR